VCSTCVAFQPRMTPQHLRGALKQLFYANGNATVGVQKSPSVFQ
jgi:hypothetical protein